MKCVVCKHGETRPGTTTVTLTRGETTLVVKGVPACVCSNCGEEYVDDATTAATGTAIPSSRSVVARVARGVHASPRVMTAISIGRGRAKGSDETDQVPARLGRSSGPPGSRAL